MNARTTRRWFSALACAAASAIAPRARADSATPPANDFTFERSSLLDRPHTVAELEVGVLALPNAPISPANQGGATPLGKFGKGDATLETGIHLLYRAGREWALGASAYFAPNPTTDSTYEQTTSLTRTHTRSYLFLGSEFRYFPVRYRWFEMWVGADAGVMVIADRFETVGAEVPTFLGTRQYTVSTTGFSIGLEIGGDYMITDNWVVGLRLRSDRWILPSVAPGSTNTSCSSIGDCPTLGGGVQAYQFGISVGYRIPL